MWCTTFLNTCPCLFFSPSRDGHLLQGWMLNSPDAHDAPNILAFIRKHNNIGLWAAAFILEKHTADERAKVYAYMCRACSEGNQAVMPPFFLYGDCRVYAIGSDPRQLTANNSLACVCHSPVDASASHVARRRSLGGLCKWQIRSGDWATTTVFSRCIVPSLATL